MRSLKYLNTVLTFIAVLLTLNLWTLWTVTPGGRMLSVSNPAMAQGAMDAGQQRRAMVVELEKTNEKLSDIVSMLKKGSAKVTVESMPDHD